MALQTLYGAESIKVLEGLEGVRKRPSMYIGSTGKDGLHHLIYEAVDNSVDEALADYCKEIKITLNKDGSATIEDDGRGIPVDTHPQYKVPAVQIALTKLHAGGKFDKKTYMISGGLHGVGISVVNALSEKLIIEIKRNGQVYRQEYSRGAAKTKLKIVKKTNKNDTGTKITFWPDQEIFSTTKFDPSVLETRFREIAFLNQGLKIVLEDEIKNKKYEFSYSGGLIEFVKWINESKEVLHKPIYFKREIKDIVIEIAIQYTNSYKESIFGFVNTINTVEGGTHISGFKTALTRVINDYAKKILESVDKIARNFFEEAFKIKKSAGYSELKKYFDKKKNARAAEFCEIMNNLLYSKEKDNNKIKKLINLLTEIAETNEIISEAEQVLRKGEISRISKEKFKNEKNNGKSN